MDITITLLSTKFFHVSTISKVVVFASMPRFYGWNSELVLIILIIIFADACGDAINWLNLNILSILGYFKVQRAFTIKAFSTCKW